MRILVLGAGAIGGYFGGRLAEAGADISFLVRAGRAAQLEARGLVVKSVCGDIARPVRLVRAGEPLEIFDVVLLSAKAYDLDSAMAAIAPAMGEGSAVLPLLNGIRHLDSLTERFGAAHLLCGTCHIGATLDPDGTVRHIGKLQRIAFGELSGAPSARTTALLELFRGSGIEAVLSEAILQVMWDKLVMLAALAATTTLTRATVGDIMATRSGEAFMLGALEECAAIAVAEGHGPGPAALAGARTMLTERGSPFAASMMRDLVAGRPTEGEHIIGDLVQRAARHGIAAPVLRAAMANLEVQEARRLRSS